MAPLGLAICLELFLVACIIWHEIYWSAALAATVLVGFTALWFLYPARYRARRERGRGEATWTIG